MTDLEITRLCAEAMGDIQMDFAGTGDPYDLRGRRPYDPLHDDAQAMALVKKLRLVVCPEEAGGWSAGPEFGPLNMDLDVQNIPDLNRAICECVAKMQQAKGAK